MSIALVYTGISIITTDTALTQRHKAAYVLTAIAMTAFFLNRTISAIFLGITLVFGTLNVIAFNPTIYYVGLGSLKIQLFPLLVLLTFIYAHRQAFKAWINKDGL